MAIASVIILWGHYQDAGFLAPKPTFFILNHNLLTTFNGIPQTSKMLFAIYSLISIAFYYMLLK